jgi:hypothetical protein
VLLIFRRGLGPDVNVRAYLEFLWKSHQHLIGFSHLDKLQMS